MSKIERFDGDLKAFASEALASSRTVFNGESQSDTLSDNINESFKKGWEHVGPNDFPTLEDFNAMGFTFGQLIAYLHQVGIPEWNDKQYYPIKAITNQNGVVYRSKIDNNKGSQPDTNPSKWKPVAGSGNRLGEPFWHLGDTPPKGALQFSSIQLNRVQYKELWDSLNASDRHIKWMTEADKTANNLYGCWSLGDGSTTFGVPDPRGDFLRVWDNGRGVNQSQNLGQWAPDEFKAHTHYWDNVHDMTSGIQGGSHKLSGGSHHPTVNKSMTTTGGSETRPRSITWMLCFYYE